MEKLLDKLGWKVDVVLSHTTLLKYESVGVFLSGVDQSKVDKSTVEWMGLRKGWSCGHYHMDKKIDRLEIMFGNFDVFCENIKDTEEK